MGVIHFIKKLLWGSGRSGAAPIKSSEPSEPFVEYRRPDDGEWVIRVSYPRPKGKDLLLEFSPVAGVSNYAWAVTSFVGGVNRRLELRQTTWEGEPAIEVWGYWDEWGEAKSAHVGYVPKERLWVNRYSDLEAMVVCVYLPRFSFSPKDVRQAGVRMDVWGTKPARKTRAKAKPIVEGETTPKKRARATAKKASEGESSE